MLRRTTRIQLIVFLVITLVGVSYVSAKYVGLTKGLFGSHGCTVSAEFADSGGIFTNAEVTYRGVTVGQVGKLHVTDNGVRVDLRLNNCNHPKVPFDSDAVVADRSVIGEQYVNLIPRSSGGPYLTSGKVIRMNRTSLPVPVHTLMQNMDNLFRSVDTASLATMISELGTAFNGRGEALGKLLDAQNALLASAQQNLPQTVSLIETGNKVFSTQLDEASAFASFNHSLSLLTRQLKTSDPDIRALLQSGPSDLSVVRSFVEGNRTDLGVTLANLATTGRLLVRYQAGLEQILELYPQLAAGGLTTTHAQGYTALGFITNIQPRVCGDPARSHEGYDGTNRRQPTDLSPQAPNVGAHCTASASSGVNVRGSQNAPGGDPIYTGGAGVAYPRATTNNTVVVGDTRRSSTSLGDGSWLAILTDALN